MLNVQNHWQHSTEVKRLTAIRKCSLPFKGNRIARDYIIFLLSIIHFMRSFLSTCPCYIFFFIINISIMNILECISAFMYLHINTCPLATLWSKEFTEICFRDKTGHRYVCACVCGGGGGIGKKERFD